MKIAASWSERETEITLCPFKIPSVPRSGELWRKVRKGGGGSVERVPPVHGGQGTGEGPDVGNDAVLWPPFPDWQIKMQDALDV